MIFERPSNEFVAGFVGEPPMNFLDCELKQEGDSYYLVSQSFRFRLPITVSQQIQHNRVASQKMKLGMRPQDMVAYREQKTGREITGEVFFWETRGDEAALMVRLEENKNLVMVSTPPDFNAIKGERVFLDFDPEKINIFDQKTTLNILASEKSF